MTAVAGTMYDLKLLLVAEPLPTPARTRRRRFSARHHGLGCDDLRSLPTMVVNVYGVTCGSPSTVTDRPEGVDVTVTGR